MGQVTSGMRALGGVLRPVGTGGMIVLLGLMAGGSTVGGEAVIRGSPELLVVVESVAEPVAGAVAVLPVAVVVELVSERMVPHPARAPPSTTMARIELACMRLPFDVRSTRLLTL